MNLHELMMWHVRHKGRVIGMRLTNMQLIPETRCLWDMMSVISVVRKMQIQLVDANAMHAVACNSYGNLLQFVTGTCVMADQSHIQSTTICLARECRRCGWVTNTMHLTIASGSDMMSSVHCRMTESPDKSSSRQKTSGVIGSWDEINMTPSIVEALASFFTVLSLPYTPS